MAQELLSSNIDGLFEKMNLEEIQQVLRKMRQEVEKKREDLRVTVGSRYRDLIEAADTIAEMKKTAEEVTDNLHAMEDKLSSLKHRQLLGFQSDVYSTEKQNKDILEEKKEYRILAAQVRLLMDLPEIIWKKLDAGNICDAAQIQQLGFHLYTGLSVESGAVGSQANIQKWFPVVNQQKVSLVSFDEIIVYESTKLLKNIQLTLENASDSCCALLLFRGGNSTQMLEEFLKFRSETTSCIMSQTGAKQQLQSYLQFIISSFATLHALFVEGFPDSSLPQALLSTKLKSICQSSANTTVELLSLTPGFLRQLPSIITDFRPSTKETWTPLPISTIRHEVQNWFQTIRSLIPKDVNQMLSCISNIKTLTSLRDVAFNTLKAEPFANQWNELSQRLLGSSVCLWGELFEPAFVEKVKTIIQGKLDSALDAVKESINQNQNVKFDTKAWLWPEVASDLPESNTIMPHTSGLHMKVRCYMPTVQELCSLWDSKLSHLREDLANYQEGELEQDGFIPFDKFGKREEIYRVLEKSCVLSVKRYISFFDWKNCAIFYFRAIIGLSELCPQLKLCVDTQQNGEGKSWSDLVDFLRQSSMDVFHAWKDHLLTTMKQNLDAQLQMNNISSSLRATPMWDEIVIEEEGEGGSSVQSRIKVPMNPSFPLQQSLFKVCQEINNIGPHAIPKKAQQCLMEDTGNALLQCYENFTKNNSSAMSQPVAFQILFDIRFIGGLLLARDNKSMQEKARSLCEWLEGQVDPFDLDVFNPHIQSHVKRAVQRLQFVFGPLLTSDRHAVLWAARLANPVSNKKPEAPSVVGLVSPSPRFLPLPLINQRSSSTETNIAMNKLSEPLSKGDTTSVNQKKPNKNKTTDASGAASAARSSAAAFFGAMSSTWGSSIFGGDK